MKIMIIAAFALVAVVTLTQGNDFPDTTVPEHLMPDFAEDVVHVQDAKADAIVADSEGKDVQLNLLEKPTNLNKEQQAALQSMESHQAAVRVQRNIIMKNIQRRAHKAKKQDAGFKRFAALRAKFVTFSQPEKQEDQHPVLAETEEDADVTEDPRHTKPAPHHRAPVTYKAVPTGKHARKEDAGLASGADANRKEDWEVHKATYRALHPSSAQMKKVAKKKKKHKLPAPLKAAQTAAHHTLDTVEQTKAILRTPLVKLTLDEAKTGCAKIRTAAQTKCDADKEHTKYDCLREGVKQETCDQKKMENAAECQVAHKTAYNECFSLWQRAKKNVKTAQKKAAAPMKQTDASVKAMDEGAKKCAGLMTKANADCDTAMSKYEGKCKAKMAVATEMSAIELTKTSTKKAAKLNKSKSGKAATKAAAKTKHTLKKAEESLKKQDASPKMKKAMDKCLSLKNVAKRTCIKVVDMAHNACDKLTSSH